MKKTYLAIALAVATFFACNSGTSSNTADSTTMGGDSNGTTFGQMDTSAANAQPVSDTGKQFMMEAAAGGMTEVQASQVAADATMNDRVKGFANMMINDHTKANSELKALATQLNVTLPDSIPPAKRDALQSMQKSTGSAFDKQYMTMMVKDHQETINKFQRASQNVDNNTLKTWATNTLPTLQMHLDSAQAIQKSLK